MPNSPNVEPNEPALERDRLPAAGAARGFACAAAHYLAVAGPQGLRVFHNRCPHLGIPLEWEPDQFMDRDTDLIRCATHGALFDPDNGLCLAGPCRGDQLTPAAFYFNDAGDLCLGTAPE